MRLAFLHRHEKFRIQVDAYLDGELAAAETARFETHLSGCAACLATVREGRELKALFASLPPVQAPRPFRLTPAMVAAVAPARPLPVRQPAMALRFAQVTAGVAIMALATVAAVDFAGGNSSSDEQTMMATGAADSTAKSAPEAASSAAPAGGRAVSQDSSSPRTLPTPVGGGAGAASNGPQAQPTPQAFASNKSATPGASSTNSFANPVRDADTFAPTPSRKSGDGPGLRLAEFALLGLFALATATWFFLARHPRRS